MKFDFMLGKSFSSGRVYKINLLPGMKKRPCKLYVVSVETLDRPVGQEQDLNGMCCLEQKQILCRWMSCPLMKTEFLTILVCRLS